MLLTIKERVELYNKAFPNYPPLVSTDRWLYGVWMIGNNYHSKQNFYGEYPNSYLERVLSMFPDKIKILHLFSGSLDKDKYKGTRFDISNQFSPDVSGDANKLATYFPDQLFDIIYADPPYSNEDAEHYGSPMVNRSRVLSECYKILPVSGFVVWLDQVLPMYRKTEFSLIGTIGLIRSTNHRFRVVSIFEKVNEE